MNGFKRLIHEIHRRSLWQVVAVFLAASWGVLEFVDFLTERAGLPDWTPGMALVLLLVGFPIVLATAFVQEGIGGEGEAQGQTAGRGDPSGGPPDRGRIEGDRGQARPAAGDPGSLPQTRGLPDNQPPPPSGLKRFLTWRNAFLGGVAAFALLGVTVFTYFVMWSTGIGPVGNLVAQGVIEAGDRVILSTFADRTEEGLGEVVTEALRVDLAQASILNLVEGVELAPALARMQVDPGTPLTGEMAREVAVREGIGALIEGEVTRAGTGYLITADLREAASGRSLASFRVTAAGPDDIIGSMDRLSREIRGKSGESLRSLRAGEPLEQVTTRSLEALRRFTEADRVRSQGDYRRALELLDQAVAIDPEFAMAWRALAVVLNNIGTDWARHDEAATQAFRHRDRLTERERYLAEGYYYSSVEKDPARAMAAYQNVLRVAPDDPAALNNLANEYTFIEDYGRAEELYRRAVNGPGRSSTAYQNLIRVRLASNDVAGAEAVLREYEAAYPEARNLPEWEYWLAFAKEDLEGARAATAPLLEDPGLPAFVRSTALARMGLASYREGKLDEGRSYLLESERVAGQVGAGFQLNQRQWTVFLEYLLGDREWARRHARVPIDDGTFESLDPVARPWAFVSRNLAFLAEGERAAAVLEAWEAFLETRGGSALDRIEMEAVRTVLDVASGRTDGKVEALERLAAEFGCSSCFLPTLAFAAAESGRTEEAIRYYERMQDRGFSDVALTGSVRTAAILELPSLYEEAGDTARAVEAYRRLLDLWANADARGMARVRQAEARLAALSEDPAVQAAGR